MAIVPGPASVELADAASAAGVLLARPGPPLLVAGGLILVSIGAVILLMASGGLDQQLPTQVLPRRFAVYPLVAGAALLAIAAMVWLLP